MNECVATSASSGDFVTARTRAYNPTWGADHGLAGRRPIPGVTSPDRGGCAEAPKLARSEMRLCRLRFQDDVS
jgi:hypothetical protein